MSRQVFTKTAYENLSDFVYGKSIYPVKLKNGMSIGGGTVYPEVNFTLPPMLITKDTMPEVLENYRGIITGICERAKELFVPGFVAEIETLPPMTFEPAWGVEVCKTVVNIIKEYEVKHGIKGAVRITPNDIREGRDLEHIQSFQKNEPPFRAMLLIKVRLGRTFIRSMEESCIHVGFSHKQCLQIYKTSKIRCFELYNFNE